MEISTRIFNVIQEIKSIIRDYSGLTPELQKKVRHNVYSRCGKWGKWFFGIENINRLIELYNELGD